MHLWRNLPEGQLLAVLRWMQNRREAGRPADGAGAADSAPRPVEPVEPAARSPR
jgi:hypothetical protein